jgi:hypothetical protein
MTTDRWTRFGWQGLCVDVPADWELVGIPKEHDPDQGYLRLDDAAYPRLELKWRAHSQRQFDIQKSLNEYLSGVRKSYRQDVGNLDIARDVTLIPQTAKNAEFFADREVSFFSWRGRLNANGVIWRCHRCRRVIMSQVVGSRAEEAFKALSVRVLQSLQCHPTGRTNLWTAYGLGVDVPRSLRLDKLQLLNGYILFSFNDGSRRLVVERYGLADQLLRGSSLESWFRRAYAKSLRGIAFVVETTNSGLVVDGKTERLLDTLDRFDTGIGRFWDKAFRRSRMMTSLRHDAERNRIYVVRVVGKSHVTETVEAVARSIRDEATGLVGVPA